MPHPSRSSAVTTKTSSARITSSRPFSPGLRITAPVMMSWRIRAAATPTPVSRSR